jgi:hypothetical protein
MATISKQTDNPTAPRCCAASDVAKWAAPLLPEPMRWHIKTKQSLETEELIFVFSSHTLNKVSENCLELFVQNCS